MTRQHWLHRLRTAGLPDFLLYELMYRAARLFFTPPLQDRLAREYLKTRCVMVDDKRPFPFWRTFDELQDGWTPQPKVLLRGELTGGTDGRLEEVTDGTRRHLPALNAYDMRWLERWFLPYVTRVEAILKCPVGVYNVRPYRITEGHVIGRHTDYQPPHMVKIMLYRAASLANGALSIKDAEGKTREAVGRNLVVMFDSNRLEHWGACLHGHRDCIELTVMPSLQRRFVQAGGNASHPLNPFRVETKRATRVRPIRPLRGKPQYQIGA